MRKHWASTLAVSGFREDWENNYTIPYVLAYNKACYNYKKTLEDQAKSDKTQAELFVMAASILSGSVLMAVFATTSVRTKSAGGGLTSWVAGVLFGSG